MSGKDSFFVGYLPAPVTQRPFLISVGLSLVGFFALTAWMIGTAQDDPGDGSFRFDLGRQTVTGVIETLPYPILHVTEGNDNIPTGHTLMLSGGGKNGAIERADPLEGMVATVSGVLLTRGDLDMIQLRGGRNGLAEADGDDMVPEPESLGRWRLAGEICDGKCLAGAMRPGRGLAHKACADLCITGGIPPVFVSSQPVQGEEFLMITGPDGTLLPDAAKDRIGQYVQAEGQVTRHGGLLVFALDPATIEVLP